MFMASTRSENTDIGRQLFDPGAILIVADGDLLSDCLGETLSNKFLHFEIISKSAFKAALPGGDESLKLVLFYGAAEKELQDSIKSLRSTHPETSIGLVVDAIDLHEPYISKFVETRLVDGILPLNLRLDVFMAAIDLLIKGGEHFPSALLSRLVRGGHGPSPDDARAAPGADGRGAAHSEKSSLTTREVQILDLICKGTQNKIIAAKLHLSENTVKVHVRNIYKKMNVRNRTEAASRFFDTRHDANQGTARKWDN